MTDKIIEAKLTLDEIQSLWLLAIRERNRLNDTDPKLQNLSRKLLEYKNVPNTLVSQGLQAS